MKTLKITCDSCNHDLTYADGGHDHLIHMHNETLLTIMGELPFPMRHALDSEKHFCGIACVYRWISKNFNIENIS